MGGYNDEAKIRELETWPYLKSLYSWIASHGYKLTIEELTEHAQKLHNQSTWLVETKWRQQPWAVRRVPIEGEVSDEESGRFVNAEQLETLEKRYFEAAVTRAKAHVVRTAFIEQYIGNLPHDPDVEYST